MGVREIGRRLVGGVWVTDVRDENGGGGSQPIETHTVTLQSSDILALDATPFTLVPAVSGKIVVPFLVMSSVEFVTAAYANAGQSRIFIGATWGTSGWGASENDPLGILATKDTALFFTPASTNMALDNSESLTSLVNQPFNTSSSGAVTDGGGSVTVTTLYYLLTP